MASTNATTIELQKEELDVLTATDMISSLLHLLQQMRNDDASLQGIMKVCLPFLEKKPFR